MLFEFLLYVNLGKVIFDLGVLIRNIDLLTFSSSQVPQYHDLKRNSMIETTSRFIAEEEVLDAIFYSKV